jgi:hypothetical protein
MLIVDVRKYETDSNAFLDLTNANSILNKYYEIYSNLEDSIDRVCSFRYYGGRSCTLTLRT